MIKSIIKNSTLKKILTAILLLTFVFSFIGCSNGTYKSIDGDVNQNESNLTTFVEDFSNYAIGNSFIYGEYPQTKVEDVRLIAYLEEQNVEMKSYSFDDVTYSYGDFEYEHIKYRRINWIRDSSYRDNISNEEYPYGENIYFVWNPIEWTIIGEVDGEWQALSSIILDGKCLYDTEECKTWAESKCRKWLNSEFTNDAFIKSEVDAISKTNTSEEDYQSEDKIYLMSFDDMTNGKFGFKGLNNEGLSNDSVLCDYNRATKYSDYANFFGVGGKYRDTYGEYFLRTKDKESMGGAIRDKENDNYFYNVVTDIINAESGYNENGIRPAFRIKKDAKVKVRNFFV